MIKRHAPNQSVQLLRKRRKDTSIVFDGYEKKVVMENFVFRCWVVEEGWWPTYGHKCKHTHTRTLSLSLTHTHTSGRARKLEQHMWAVVVPLWQSGKNVGCALCSRWRRCGTRCSRGGVGEFHVACGGGRNICVKVTDPTFHVTMPNQKKLLNKANSTIKYVLQRWRTIIMSSIDFRMRN